MPARTYRQSPRLKEFDYLGPLAAHVVLVTRNRQPILSDVQLAESAVEWLDETAKRYDAIIHAYCVMPDHMHLLVEIPEGVSLQRVVRWFKQMSGHELKQRLGSPCSQVSYYDHILRKQEAIEDVARYVWNNPVIDGLVDDWTAHPLSGPHERLVAYQTSSQV
jgi:putative transposase